MDEHFIANTGECILYDWIEIIKDYLQQLDFGQILNETKRVNESVISSSTNDKNTGNLTPQVKHTSEDLVLSDKNCDRTVIKDIKAHQYKNQITVLKCPEIYTGDVIEDRKSVFQGHFSMVDEVQMVTLVLEKLKENKKIKNATHPTMYAYRIEQKGTRSVIKMMGLFAEGWVKFNRESYIPIYIQRKRFCTFSGRSGYFQDCDDCGESKNINVIRLIFTSFNICLK